MFDRVCLAVIAFILTVLSALSVAGHGPFAGKMLFAITHSHGVDQGDLPVIVLWLVGMLVIALLWRRTYRDD